MDETPKTMPNSISAATQNVHDQVGSFRKDGNIGGTVTGRLPPKSEVLTDEQILAQVGSGNAAGPAIRPTEINLPRGAEFFRRPEGFVDVKFANVVQREEHDLTRMIDQAKGWSEKEAAMFVELVERRLQSMEQRLSRLEGFTRVNG